MKQHCDAGLVDKQFVFFFLTVGTDDMIIKETLKGYNGEFLWILPFHGPKKGKHQNYFKINAKTLNFFLRKLTLALMQEGIIVLLSSLQFGQLLRQLISEKGSNLYMKWI